MARSIRGLVRRGLMGAVLTDIPWFSLSMFAAGPVLIRYMILAIRDLVSLRIALKGTDVKERAEILTALAAYQAAVNKMPEPAVSKIAAPLPVDVNAIAQLPPNSDLPP